MGATDEYDADIYMVGVRESTDPEARSLVFQEGYDDEDSYCLVIDPGQATFYGGVIECTVSDDQLHLLLSESAAEELGTPTELRFSLMLPLTSCSSYAAGLLGSSPPVTRKMSRDDSTSSLSAPCPDAASAVGALTRNVCRVGRQARSRSSARSAPRPNATTPIKLEAGDLPFQFHGLLVSVAQQQHPERDALAVRPTDRVSPGTNGARQDPK